MTASIRLSVKQGRKFGLTLGIALLVLGGLSIWRGHDIVPLFLLFPGAIMMLAGLLVPTRLGPVERGPDRRAAAPAQPQRRRQAVR